MSTATGTFDVHLTPQALEEDPDGGTLERLSIDKQFRGDLEYTLDGDEH